MPLISLNHDAVSVHGCHDMFALDASSPHAWACDPSRQLEIAGCRCELFLPILRGVARAVQAVLQQPAHVLIACLVVLWRQFDEDSFFVRERRNTPFRNGTTFPPRSPVAPLAARRRRRVQLWLRVRFVFLRDSPRAHVRLPRLPNVSLRPSCLDRCLPRFA